MRAAATALLIALLLAVTGAAPGAAAEEEAVPLPVDRSAILREAGAVYYVEGRQTIPKGVTLSVQREVRIRGRGRQPTLRVEGMLTVQGVPSRHVIFEGVTVELATEFDTLILDTVIFREGGGVRVPRSGAAAGRVRLSSTQFGLGAGLDLTLSGGSVELSNVTSNDPTRIVGAVEEGKRRVLRVTVRGSDVEGLVIANVRDATVRLTRITGELTAYTDCDALEFDGNKVNARRIEITHSEPGGLSKTALTKCDVYSDSLLLRTPRRDGKALDRVPIDRCWFRGETDEEALRKKLVRDGEDEEQNGATARFLKIEADPNELAGPLDR